MKKLCNLLLTAMIMISMATPVSALTKYEFNDWTAGDGYGTKAKDEKNPDITNMKGTFDEKMGMYVGPYSKKAGNLKITDGIEEETYVEIDLDKIKNGEFFEVSLALKNGDEYANEAVVMTQKTSDNELTVTAGWANGIIAKLSKTDVYTYNWKYTLEDKIPYVVFTIYDSEGNVVGKTDKVNINLHKSDEGKDINDTTNTTVKYLWFCNVNVSGGLNVYSKLPGVVVNVENNSKENANVQVPDTEQLNSILSETLKDPKYAQYAELLKTNDGKVEVKSKDITVSAEETKEFESVIPNSKVSEFFDLSILLTVADKEHYLTDLSGEITFTINIPEAIKGNNRTYYVLRKHDNVIEPLDTTLSSDGKTLTFSSDKFSTYAIVYKENNVANPKTYDGVITYFILGGASLIAIAGVVVYLSKKKLFN